EQCLLELRDLFVETQRDPRSGAVTVTRLQSQCHTSYDDRAYALLAVRASEEVVARVDRQPDDDQEESENDEDRRLGDRRLVLLGCCPTQKTGAEERCRIALRPDRTSVADEEAEHKHQ